MNFGQLFIALAGVSLSLMILPMLLNKKTNGNTIPETNSINIHKVYDFLLQMQRCTLMLELF